MREAGRNETVARNRDDRRIAGEFHCPLCGFGLIIAVGVSALALREARPLAARVFRNRTPAMTLGLLRAYVGQVRPKKASHRDDGEACAQD